SFPDRAVRGPALCVPALRARAGPPERRLAGAVLGAALDAAGHAPLVEGAEALAGDAAAIEDQLGEAVVLGALGGAVVDPGARNRAGELRAEYPVVGIRPAWELDADAGAVEDLLGDPGDLA